MSHPLNCLCIYSFLLFPPVSNPSQGFEGFAGSWGSMCFLNLLLHASAGKAQLPTASGSMQPHWDPKIPLPSGAGLSLLSCAHTSAAPWQGCPLAGSQLAWVCTKLQVLLLWTLWREYWLKTGAKKGEGEDGMAEEHWIHSPWGNMFWYRADRDSRAYNLLHATAHISQNKPFKKTSMLNLIKLLVCKEENSNTHYW